MPDLAKLFCSILSVYSPDNMPRRPQKDKREEVKISKIILKIKLETSKETLNKESVCKTVNRRV